MRRYILKKTAAFILLLLFCCAVGKSWHYLKDGFSIGRINLGFSQTRAAPFFDPELKEAFCQKYFYLSRGRQCYAFASEDGRYVLKFPRSDSYKVPFWLRACSFSFLDSRRELCFQAKKNRLNWLMTSFSLAHSDLKKETALLYLHLCPTNHLKARVFIQDPLGRSYSLDLDQTAFALQEKKPLLIPLFQERLNRGDREGAKLLLEAFMDVVSIRAKKGIFNKDGSFLRNFGFDGQRAIQVDIGDFYRPNEKDLGFVFSFQQTMGHVVQWLGQVDLEMQSWLKMRISERVQ